VHRRARTRRPDESHNHHVSVIRHRFRSMAPVAAWAESAIVNRPLGAEGPAGVHRLGCPYSRLPGEAGARHLRATKASGSKRPFMGTLPNCW
jgi:hypothetical protein